MLSPKARGREGTGGAGTGLQVSEAAGHTHALIGWGPWAPGFAREGLLLPALRCGMSLGHRVIAVVNPRAFPPRGISAAGYAGAGYAT